jgi:hypothetical protein
MKTPTQWLILTVVLMGAFMAILDVARKICCAALASFLSEARARLAIRRPPSDAGLRNNGARRAGWAKAPRQ